MPETVKVDSQSIQNFPEPVITWFERPCDRPFESDAEYVESLSIRAYLQYELREARQRTVGAVFSNPEHESQARAMLESLEAVTREASRRIAARLRADGSSGWKPRLIRLGERYGWTERELATFEFMIVQSVMINNKFPEDEIHQAMAASRMSIDEMLRFIDSSRDHIQDELFEVDKGLYSNVFKADFKLQDEVVKAVVGARLSTEDLLKLDGTALLEVLAEEPGFVAPDGIEGNVSLENPSIAADDLQPDQERVGAVAEVLPCDDIKDHDEEEPDEGNFIFSQDASEASSSLLEPYSSDLEYLEDHFRYIAARIRRVGKEQADDDDFRLSRERSKSSILKELRGKERACLRTCVLRLGLTERAGTWMPRLEKLVATRGLDDFEKWMLLTLVGLHISEDIRKAGEIRRYASTDVGDLLTLWTDGLEDQVARRKHFYKSGRLIQEGLIHVESSLISQLSSQSVEIDRRIMDFIVGLDSEASDLVEGSHLYSPKVRLESVVLPPEQKKLILETVGTFDALRKAREQLGLDEAIAYGRGLVMLFYGPSGTGKTMLANGIANHLGKKIFLVNFPSLGMAQADEVLALLFREARIHEAILFFDECDSIFETRDKGNASISTLLTEIERHDGPMIMATNRPFDLDEAMSRRITLAIEFRAPDPHLRAEIWRVHLPRGGASEDVDIADLARKYELTGGFIKNAVLSALAFAVARDPEQPRIQQEDLERGAQLQLRSRLRMADLERSTVPTHGLDWLVAPERVRKVLWEVVQFEKARKVLYGQWGFDRVDGRGQGVIALFHGVPGTGKTQAAEGIAYEIGRPLRMVNPAELLSKWVGETAKNIDALFTDLRNHDAVLLFEEAEGLFGERTEAVTASDRYANVDTGLLLHNIERYPGLVILTTNMAEAIDPAFQRRIRYAVEFPMPSETERISLWRQLLPEEVPLSSDVDLNALAARFPLSGGSIKNAVYRAAARTALRSAEQRVVTMADLVDSATEEAASWMPGEVGFCRQRTE